MAFTHRLDGTTPHQHDTVVQARDCLQEAAEAYYEELQAEAEIAAEIGYERHLEDRGWAEARAFEEWEAARGVVQFGDAMRMAEASR